MKVYIILFLLGLSYQSICQDTIRIEDIVKKSKRKSSSGLQVNSRDSKVYSGNSYDALAAAISPYIFKIETQYQLKKDGEVYGTEETPYFGRAFGMGISMGKEIWVDPTLARPWTVDPNFEDQRAEYDGQLYKVNLTAISSGSVAELYGTKFTANVNELGFGTIEMKNRGFEKIEISTTLKYGTMLILYYGKGDESIDSLERKVVFMNQDLKNHRNSISELNDKNLLGGFLLEMEPQRGSILLKFVGMVVRSSSSLNKLEIMTVIHDGSLKNEEKKSSSELPEKDNDKPKVKPKAVGINNNTSSKRK